MAETDVHRNLMTYLIEALKLWFAAARRVYVSGNNLLYYVKGDPRKSVSPDVYVVRGVAKRDRNVYKLWEERQAPRVVIEVSSRGTKRADLVTKFQLYRDVLRVKEYYVYDPLREYLPSRLRAWELTGGAYVERLVTGQHIASPELGLILADTERWLRLVDPKTGRELPGLAESEARAREAEAARERAEAARKRAEAVREAEAKARRAAEAEVERLQERLRRLRRGR